MALINQINLTCNQDRMQASQAVVSVNQPSIVVSAEVIASTGWLVLTFNKYQYNIIVLCIYINIEDTNQSPIKQEIVCKFLPSFAGLFYCKAGPRQLLPLHHSPVQRSVLSSGSREEHLTRNTNWRSHFTLIYFFFYRIYAI